MEKVEDDFILYASDVSVILQELLRFADEQKLRLSNIRTEIPNMDDVFLTLII